jgi:hypothetical protein
VTAQRGWSRVTALAGSLHSPDALPDRPTPKGRWFCCQSRFDKPHRSAGATQAPLLGEERRLQMESRRDGDETKALKGPVYIPSCAIIWRLDSGSEASGSVRTAGPKDLTATAAALVCPTSRGSGCPERERPAGAAGTLGRRTALQARDGSSSTGSTPLPELKAREPAAVGGAAAVSPAGPASPSGGCGPVGARRAAGCRAPGSCRPGPGRLCTAVSPVCAPARRRSHGRRLRVLGPAWACAARAFRPSRVWSTVRCCALSAPQRRRCGWAGATKDDGHRISGRAPTPFSAPESASIASVTSAFTQCGHQRVGGSSGLTLS